MKAFSTNFCNEVTKMLKEIKCYHGNNLLQFSHKNKRNTR